MIVQKCRNVFRLSIWNYFASFEEGSTFSFLGKGNFDGPGDVWMEMDDQRHTPPLYA